MNVFKRAGLLVLLLLTASFAASAQPKAAVTGKSLAEFSLKDPRGKVYARKDLLEHGAVIVVTAPILSNKHAQEDWSKYLRAAKNKNKGRLVFLEDMSPSAFKGTALKSMKKQSAAGEGPLLLIDPKGELRKKLGVEEEATVVLAFDSKGKLVHEEKGKPSAGAAAQIWKSLE